MASPLRDPPRCQFQFPRLHHYAHQTAVIGCYRNLSSERREGAAEEGASEEDGNGGGNEILEAVVPPLRLAGRGGEAGEHELPFALANKTPFENTSGRVWVSHNSRKHTAPFQEQPAVFHCRVVTVTAGHTRRLPPRPPTVCAAGGALPVLPSRHWGDDGCPAEGETKAQRGGGVCPGSQTQSTGPPPLGLCLQTPLGAPLPCRDPQGCIGLLPASPTPEAAHPLSGRDGPRPGCP